MRSVHAIPGGIHPAENKLQSLRRPIEPAGIPEIIILPLAQHIGSPAEAIVTVGEYVKKGQKVADATGFVSAPVHAPTSGEVIAIEPRSVPHPSGMSAACVVIRPDGRDEWVEHRGLDDYTSVDKAALIHRIQDAGIVGLGGAGFPSNVKLSIGPHRRIATLIINGTECEPYITADDILMRERADEIIAGVRILQHLLGPAEVLIGIEDNKPQAIDVMRAAAADTGFEVVEFPTKYPSGGEKQLIQILTGLEVPSGGLPADLGIVVHNIGTAVAVHRAITFGEPLLSRITTVTGDAVDAPGNFEVLLGTPMSYLLERAGIRREDAARLVMGGPMMGFALGDSDVPVIKTTNCILVPTATEVGPPAEPQACIRCGMCAQACPASLLPQQLYWFSLGGEHEKLESHNLFDCIECGCCSWVCPSNIPLVQYYRASKAGIRKQKETQAKAERSRIRFEARQARLERERAEKEARRRARQQAAKTTAGSDDGKTAVVEAAIKRAKSKSPPPADEQSVPAAGATDPTQISRDHSGTPRDDDATEISAIEQVARLERRIANTRAACEQAEAQGGDKLEALRTSLETLNTKLAEAKQAAAAESSATAIDPAQAAIERARARRAGGEKTPPKVDVAGIEKRLATARDKLAQAEQQSSERVEAFRNSVAKLESKLAEARAAESATAADDPVTAAIERAKARRAAGGGAQTPGQKVANLKKRLAAARAKLSDAEENGLDTADILRDSVQKLEDKLSAAERELVDADPNG